MTTSTLEIDRDTAALRAILRRVGACRDAWQWSRGMGLRQAWMTCPRGDWLLRLAAMLGVDLEPLTLATSRCARLALVHVPAGEGRPQQTIETAEAWCRGEATLDHVGVATIAAYAAAAAYAVRDAAAHAACAAARVADAVLAGSDVTRAEYVAAAAVQAASARAAAAYAATDAAYVEAQADTLRECADLVRETIPYSTIAAAARRVFEASK